MKTKALTKEKNTILILPSLIEAVGFNEAIFLSQLHHLQFVTANGKDKERHLKEGWYWVWNSAPEWADIFKGVMKEWTIRQTIYSLERQGLVISGCFNRMVQDQTKWYRIDYQKLVELYPEVKWGVEIQQAICGFSTGQRVNFNKAIPDTTYREQFNNKLLNLYKGIYIPYENELVDTAESLKDRGDEQNVPVSTNVVQSDQYSTVTDHARTLFGWTGFKVPAIAEATPEDWILALDRFNNCSWWKAEFPKTSKYFLSQEPNKGIEKFLMPAIKDRLDKVRQAKYEAEYEIKQKEEAKLRKEQEELDRIEQAKDRELQDKALELHRIAVEKGYEYKPDFLNLGLEPLARDFKELLREGTSHKEIQEAISRINDHNPFGWKRQDFRSFISGATA